MSIQDLLVVGLTVIALAAVGYALYIRLRAKRFTRERYAFAFLTGSTGLFVTVVTTLLAEPPWIAFANLFHHWLPNIIPQPAQAHWITRTLILFGFIVLVLLQYRIWQHWSGGRSVRQVEAERNREQISVLDEGIAEGRRLLRREPPLERFAGTGDREFDTIIESPTDLLAWRDQARELVELRWPSLRVDPHNDWHDREDVWVGRNTRADRLAAVLVVRTAPTEARIEHFLDYIRELRGYRSGNNELFILVQENVADTVLEVHGERIEQYSESKLLDSLVDFSDYFDKIRAGVQVDKLPDSDLTLYDTYVRSHLLDKDYKPLGQDLEEFLRDWMQEPSQRQVAVLGEYGQGKSTGAWLFAYHLVQDYTGCPPRVPLVIELRGKSPATLQPIELLAAWAAQRGLNPRALMKLLIAGRLILIFEGFDEMAEAGDTEARLKHFRNLWRFCYPQSKLVFTGRPNFLLDQQERRIALGIDESSGSGPYCQAVRLSPFWSGQIRESLRWTEDRVADEILALAETDPAFFDVVARPSLLFLVANLWDTEAFIEARHKQINSATVIGLFVKNTLRRQTEKSRHHYHFMILNESELAYFMDGIAAYMAHHDLPNQISLRQRSTRWSSGSMRRSRKRSRSLPTPARHPPDARSKRVSRTGRMPWSWSRPTCAPLGYWWRTRVRPAASDSATNPFWNGWPRASFSASWSDNQAGSKGDTGARSQSIMNATGVSLTDGLESPQSLSFLGQLCASRPDMLADPSLMGKGVLSLSPINFRCLWKNKRQAILDIRLFLKRQIGHRSPSEPESFPGWGWTLGSVLGRVFYGIYGVITAGSRALPRTTVWLAAGIAAGMTRQRMVKIVGEDTATEIGERLYAVLDEKVREQAGFERPKIQE